MTFARKRSKLSCAHDGSHVGVAGLGRRRGGMGCVAGAACHRYELSFSRSSNSVRFTLFSDRETDLDRAREFTVSEPWDSFEQLCPVVSSRQIITAGEILASMLWYEILASMLWYVRLDIRFCILSYVDVSEFVTLRQAHVQNHHKGTTEP
jgi:hypothetical protein